MLTESEKRWLQLRKLYAGVNHHSYYSCMHCQSYNVDRWDSYNYPCNNACVYEGCPNIDIRNSSAISDYIEAVEFEAKVAAKLAKAFKEYVKRRNCVDFEVGTRCPGWEVCAANYKKRLPCDFAIMKGVQLEVEEEMDE